MPEVPIRLTCSGCGAEAAPDRPWPFRCKRAASDDGVDHVIGRVLDLGAIEAPRDDDPNPFVRYRTLHLPWHLWRARGRYDASYIDLVRRLDTAVKEVAGRGLVVTPLARNVVLSDELGFSAAGGVGVKDETGNVGGSHKVRHLAGITLYLEVMERLGLAPARGASDHGLSGPKLAIASCGNAALAAAVLARATGRPLDVYAPATLGSPLLERLADLGAGVVPCVRTPGKTGDPCVRRFREALGAGALPFCCQGNANGLTIEGGMTLAWEVVESMAAAGRQPDRLFVQVGGGALASACAQAMREASLLGVLTRAPRLHAVQTRGAWPLARAYERVTGRMLMQLGSSPVDDDARADLLRHRRAAAEVKAALADAATHRADFMWPWEEEPQSVAEGILDDETYDWHAVVTGMIESGGTPVVVDEDTLCEAHALAARAGGGAGGAVSPTGAAGLAGLVSLSRSRRVGPDENVVVLFSGVDLPLRLPAA